MKFLHISDLHLGKKVNEFSMLEQQEYILTQVVQLAIQHQVDGILLAGDIYDKPIPPIEAIELFEHFLTLLSKNKIGSYIISGNHDSAQRLSFGAKFMQEHHIYISETFNGSLQTISLTDTHGEFYIHLLPFIKPAYVRSYYPDETIENYQDALEVVIKHSTVDISKRNILLSHQFVLGAKTCESEEISIGGLDQIAVTAYDGFDYVALGHLHSPQAITNNVRYSGSIYPYSLSERHHQKCAILIDMQEKGNTQIEILPLQLKNKFQEIKGTYLEVTQKSFYEHLDTNNYYHIILTDEEDIMDAIGKLRTIYPRIMQLSYDNTRTRNHQDIQAMQDIEKKSPIILIDEFYQLQNNQGLTEEQKAYCLQYFEEVTK